MITVIGIYYVLVSYMYAAFSVLKPLRPHRDAFFPVLATKDLSEKEWFWRLFGISWLATGLSVSIFLNFLWLALAISIYEVYLSFTFYLKRGELFTVMGILRLLWNGTIIFFVIKSIGGF